MTDTKCPVYNGTYTCQHSADVPHDLHGGVIPATMGRPLVRYWYRGTYTPVIRREALSSVRPRV